MRTSALIISAFLGAGALAHPFHVHHKREERGKLVNSHVSGNTLIQEYETVYTVVRPEGQQDDDTPPPAQPSPAAKQPTTQIKYTQDDDAWKAKIAAYRKSQEEKHQQTQPQQPQPQPQQPAKVEAKKEDAPVKTETKADSSSPPSSGACTSPDTISGDASAWATNPCSGGQTILDIFNDMRGKWNPSLASSPYKWSAALAKNSHDTAWLNGVNKDGKPEGEAKATRMAHKLFDGSMGQCIAEHLQGQSSGSGVDSSFGSAAKMWMCEMKQGPFCDEQTTSVGPDAQGHAKIIQGTGNTHVGCHFMWGNDDKNANMGMWTCDFGTS